MNIASETFAFFLSVIVGFTMGMFYDVFRIFRISFKNPKWLVFVEDVAYFSVISIITFMIVLNYNNGKLRGFLVVGELLGAICYFFTLSVLIMKLANGIINFVRSVFSFISRRVLSPIYRGFLKFFGFIAKKVKNIAKNIKKINFHKKST